MWNDAILGAGFAFAAAVQPGPFQTFLVSETLRRGWRRTWPGALAPLVSDAPIVAAALFVLGRIPDRAVGALHLAGALFLVWLTRDAWRSWRSRDTEDTSEAPAGAPATLPRAALVNFLNPNPWLGWTLVLGPLVVAGYRVEPLRAYVLVGAFYVVLIGANTALIGIVAVTRRLGPAVRRVTLGISVLALGAFAGYQFLAGVRALVDR